MMKRSTLPCFLLFAAAACGDADSETGGTTFSSGSADQEEDTTNGSRDETGAMTSTNNDEGSDTTDATRGETAATESDGTEGGDGDGPDPRRIELERYAPRIWFTADESYMPSTVEWAFPYMTRFPDSEGRYWVRSTEGLSSASDTLPFFAGDLDSATVYAYWADKGEGVVDLVYFLFYPYNRGKSVVDTIWGNHVGDWEHITVRLLEDTPGAYLPSQVYLSAHSFGGAYDWDGGEVELFEGTHPIVYAAEGSHGFWAQPGDHVYQTIGETDPLFDTCVTLVCADLTDITSAGVAWNTWEHITGMDFFAQEGLDGAEWPSWMSDAFTEPGEGDPALPESGPIYRWGNEEDCSVLGIPVDITDLIGVCRLENGPTGPVSKSTWGAELK